MSKKRIVNSIQPLQDINNDNIYKMINDLATENSMIHKKIKRLESQNKDIINKNDILECELDNLYEDINDINDTNNINNNGIQDELESKIDVNKYIKQKLMEKFNITTKDINKKRKLSNIFNEDDDDDGDSDNDNNHPSAKMIELIDREINKNNIHRYPTRLSKKRKTSESSITKQINEIDYLKPIRLRSNKTLKNTEMTSINCKNLIENIVETANDIINNRDGNIVENRNKVEVENDLINDIGGDGDGVEYGDMDDNDNVKKYNIEEYNKHLDLSFDYCKIVGYELINYDELDYFIDQDCERKEELLHMEKQFNEYNKIHNIPKKYKIMNMEIDEQSKKHIINNINYLNTIDKSDSEYSKMNKWLDDVCKIPFNNYIKPNLPDLYSDKQILQDYLENSRQNMDKIIYGQNNSKDRIIEILGKIIRSGNSKGNIFSVYGPPGVGKTSLIKEGLSNVLGIPFQLISLGGLFDSAYIKGSDYSYIGSLPGIIAKSLIRHKCMNPIFYFDELDKVSSSVKGQEIINTIIHLADKTQNDEFYDNYFNGIKLDLSQCIFIFSFNDKKSISSTLLDRMEMIKMDGYDLNEKITIVMNYTIPKMYKEFNISDKELIIGEQTVRYILNNYCTDGFEGSHEYLHMNYKKTGVRKLNKCIESIFNKINVILLTGNYNKLKFNKLTLPIIVDNFIVDELLVKNNQLNPSVMNMYT